MNEKFIIEKTSFYKLWLTFFVTIDASVMAWFFNNANKVSLLKIIIVILTISIVTGAIIVLTQKTRKMIKNLEENE
jgi:hypothetical protein